MFQAAFRIALPVLPYREPEIINSCSEIGKVLKKQYGDNPLENKNYGKIINERHFERLCGLIDKSKVIIGGETNIKTMQIAPCYG